MANVLLMARRVSVILLATLGTLTLVSGILLQTMPIGPGSGYATALGLRKSTWTDIHVYAGFAAAGAAIVHVYSNYRALLYHLGIVRPRRRVQQSRQQGVVAARAQRSVGQE